MVEDAFTPREFPFVLAGFQKVLSLELLLFISPFRVTIEYVMFIFEYVFKYGNRVLKLERKMKKGTEIFCNHCLVYNSSRQSVF